MHRRLGARDVQQVLDVAHPLHLAGLGDELFDQVGTRNLTAQLNDAVLHVDVQFALRDVGVPEYLAPNLVRERGVVEVLLLFPQMLRLLGDAVPLGCGPASGACGPPAA